MILYDKKFTTVTTHTKMFKIAAMKNDECKYTLQFASCTKSMTLFELCLKEKAKYFRSDYVFLLSDV